MCNMPSKPSKTEDDYRNEEDHRTLTRAEEIRMDPKRMTGVRKFHVKTARTLNRMTRSITGKSMTARGARPAGSRARRG